MLLIDNVLASPFRGLFWIFRELHKAVQEEAINEAESITQQLSELYMMLETGKISEAEFDEREEILLDQLDALENQGADQQAQDG